ncbi:hypothetical protein C8Q70DRAFT_1056431 [Cubamyces menziesii]|uniref:Uncharacterized protein n=1 Tax=Trametes cubensis TaxID=1111947 RepID=A0AAD7U0N5_9APHY|nr:hypothetical protein C8Q70DRAFT_1056431 [Cubamyces menziesii]KAJ8495168.1 hypothetical protein ONZ51_g1856 [Trametes cubensis]
MAVPSMNPSVKIGHGLTIHCSQARFSPYILEESRPWMFRLEAITSSLSDVHPQGISMESRASSAFGLPELLFCDDEHLTRPAVHDRSTPIAASVSSVDTIRCMTSPRPPAAATLSNLVLISLAMGPVITYKCSPQQVLWRRAGPNIAARPNGARPEIWELIRS